MPLLEVLTLAKDWADPAVQEAHWVSAPTLPPHNTIKSKVFKLMWFRKPRLTKKKVMGKSWRKKKHATVFIQNLVEHPTAQKKQRKTPI